MKLDFILSQTLGGSVLGAVEEVSKLPKTENVLVLVPEDSSLMIEKLLLEKNSALSNVSVYSFVRLLEKINNKNRNRYLDRECAILVIRKIILDNFDKLVCFKKSAKAVGFPELIYDTIAQLKASKISPEEVLCLQDTCSATLKIKLKDIALIYREYQNFLAGNMLDNCDKLDLLISEVSGSQLVKNSRVFVVGFDNLTAQGADLIEALSFASKGVVVACQYIAPNAPNHHISDNELYEKIKHIADRHKIEYNPQIFTPKMSKTQKQMAENLYAYPYKSTDDCGGVVLFEATSPQKEAEFVAEEIYRDLFNKVVEPCDIAVVCPDLETYSQYLIPEFSNRGVPLFINKSVSLSSHPLFALIKKFMDTIKRNFDSADVLILSKNALLNLKTDIFENFVLKYAINHTGFLRPFITRVESAEKDEAERVRGELVGLVLKLKTKIDVCKKTRDYCEAINDFLNEIDIKTRLNELYKTEMMLDPLSAKVTEQVLEKCTKIFDNFVNFLGESECDKDTFCALFDAALDALKINLLPLNISSVVVGESPSSISPKIKQVYVLGALDGAIPYRQDDCGLIADAELSGLSDLAQKKIEPTIKTVNKRERLKVYNLLLLPSEKLTLTYPAFSIAGEENKPSNLIDMVSKLFIKNELPQRIITSFDKSLKFGAENNNLALYFGAKGNAEKKLMELVRAEKDDTAQMDITNISAVYNAIKDELAPATREVLAHINDVSEPEKIDNADELFFGKKTVSISQLEKYFSCPYSHFATYGLRLKERELGGIKSMDVGNILHLVAEKFVGQMNIINAENIDKIAQKVINQSLEELEIPREKNGVVLFIIEKEAVRLCHHLFNEQASSSFKTAECERVFGRDFKTTFDGGISLVGKIDRLDTWDSYYKIIDYKTGGISVDPADVYYGKKIQLISYLNALKGYRNLMPAAVLYFPIHNDFADGESKAEDVYKNSGLIINQMHVVCAIDNTLCFENPKSHIIKAELKNNKEVRQTGEMILKTNDGLVSSKMLDGLMDYVYRLSNKAISEILNGEASPSPLGTDGEKPCKYCPLAHCCGVEKTRFSGGRQKLSKIDYAKITGVDERENAEERNSDD